MLRICSHGDQEGKVWALFAKGVDSTCTGGMAAHMMNK